MTRGANAVEMDSLKNLTMTAEPPSPAARSWLRLAFFVAAFVAAIFMLRELEQGRQQAATAGASARAALDAQRKQAEIVALAAAAKQRAVIDETYRFLRIIGGLSSITAMGRESCEGLLRRQLESAPAYGNLGISARDGSVLCATQQLPASLRINTLARKNALVAAGWRFAEGPERAGIVLVLPIVDNGDYLGSVFSVLDPARLLQVSGVAASLVMLTSANVILAAPTAVPLNLSLRSAMNTASVVDADGVRRIYAFAPLIQEAAQTIYIAAGIPFHVAPEPAHGRFITGSVMLVLLLALAVYLAGIGRDAFLLNFIADLSAAGRHHARSHVSGVRLKWQSAIATLPWRRRARRAQEAAQRPSHTKIELREANEALKQTLERFERRNREMAILNEFSRHLQTCSQAEEVQGIVAQFSQQLFLGAAGTLYLGGASSGSIEIKRSWGRLAEQSTIIAPENCWALRLYKAHHVEGPYASLQCAHVIEPPPGGYVCMPLLSHGEILGMLHLQTPKLKASPATPATASLDLERVQDFAERAALALANLRLRETLRVQSIRDVLTGLYNRRFLEETMAMEEQRAHRSGSPIGVVMIDIDHFKRFNDSFGHAAGDALLRELGSCLRTQVREGDTACRYGGEEFTLILPSATTEVAYQRADVLRGLVALLEVEYQGRILGPVTLSIGVASYPQHGTSWREVLTAADHALYRAKRGGRNRVLTA